MFRLPLFSATVSLLGGNEIFLCNRRPMFSPSVSSIAILGACWQLDTHEVNTVVFIVVVIIGCSRMAPDSGDMAVIRSIILVVGLLLAAPVRAVPHAPCVWFFRTRTVGT